MSRKSVLSRQASLVEPELPLRAYFLSVGAALLVLLLAADWAVSMITASGSFSSLWVRICGSAYPVWYSTASGKLTQVKS